MKKLIALLLVLVMVIGMVACGKTDAPAADDPAADTPAADTPAADTPAADAPAADAPAADDPNRFAGQTLKIAAQDGGFGSQYWHDLAALFEEAYPGVTVEIQTNPKIQDIVRPQIIAGEFPDLYASGEGDDMWDAMLGSQLVENLSDVYEQNLIGTDVPLKDMLIDGVLDMKTVKPYGDDFIAVGPTGFRLNGLFYNKALFEEKGWEVPVTWDDFFALGDVAAKEGYALMTYPGMYPSYNELLIWPAIASAAGQEAVDAIANYEQGSISGNADVVAVLENFAKIGDGYLMEGTTALTHTQAQTDFLLGKALFCPNGSWLPNEMADAPRAEGFTWGLAPAPTLDESDERMFTTSINGIIIPSQAESKELAKEFLRFMYSDEAVKIQAAATIDVPRKDAAALTKDIMNPEVVGLSEINEIATAMGYKLSPLDNSKIVITDAIYNPITDIMNGDMTAAEWIAQMEDCFTRIANGE